MTTFHSGASYVVPNAIECYQEAHRKEEALTTIIIIVLPHVVFDYLKHILTGLEHLSKLYKSGTIEEKKADNWFDLPRKFDV